jgi:hypothetical protein
MQPAPYIIETGVWKTPVRAFQAKQPPVRVKKMRENKNLDPRFDSTKSGI